MIPITELMKNILQWINGFIGNYGWSIILFTVAFRLVLMPLDIKSKVDMRKYSKEMSRLKPKLDAINKKYANDPQKKQEKTAELYKKENVSMLGGCKGCIPVLLQYPLLIAFFAVFRNLSGEFAVQAANAVGHAINAADPATYLQYVQDQGWSFLWIKNIWMPDIAMRLFGGGAGSLIVPNATFAQVAKHGMEVAQYTEIMQPLIDTVKGVNGYFVLPVLAGVTQYLFTLITPQADPSAAENSSMKLMQYIFPLIFVYFTITSTAAIALYWVTSNLFMMLSQFIVNKVLDAKEKKAQAAEGGNVEYEIN